MVKKASITVFQISIENKTFIQIIARDEKLKNLCTKTGGYKILVEKTKLAAFKKKVKGFCLSYYLVDYSICIKRNLSIDDSFKQKKEFIRRLNDLSPITQKLSERISN